MSKRRKILACWWRIFCARNQKLKGFRVALSSSCSRVANPKSRLGFRVQGAGFPFTNVGVRVWGSGLKGVGSLRRPQCCFHGDWKRVRHLSSHYRENRGVVLEKSETPWMRPLVAVSLRTIVKLTGWAHDTYQSTLGRNEPDRLGRKHRCAGAC